MNSNDLEIARDRAREMQAILQNSPEIAKSEVDGQTIKELWDDWLPLHFTQCRMEVRCTGTCQFHRRCEPSYWRHHHEKVARVMGEFAQCLQLAPEAFLTVGSLYDLDYLKYPHDLGTVPLVNAHPFPIVAELERLSFSPGIRLAVLEHAPHLGLHRSTPLSLVLSACGEMVTLAAANALPPLPNGFPTTWQNCFAAIPREELTDPVVLPSRFETRVLPLLNQILAISKPVSR